MTRSSAERTEHSLSSQDLTLAVIGGGSREWLPKIASDLALCPHLGGTIQLYDVNSDAARRNARFGNWLQDLDQSVSSWEYEAVGDRATALAGADFVLCSTQYNPAETYVNDLEITQEYGVYHPVAATIGPGGLSRAMRAIPVYRDIAAAVREHCPNAWVFNYTNPLTMTTRALYEEYPDINAVGFCHEVFSTQEHLAELVETYWDVDRPDRDEIDVNVKGINHFTWVDEARCRGDDLFPLLEHHLQQDGAIQEYSNEELDEASFFVDNQQITYELYERFGILPAAGDRHLAEYAPWFLQGEMPDDLRRWGIKRTTPEYRETHWSEQATEQTLGIERVMDDPEDFDIEESGEVTVEVIQALVGDQPFETNVNLPNVGQIPDLPDDAVVETNAVFDANAVQPMAAGQLPRQVRNMTLTHVHNQETLIEAAFAEGGGDFDLAFRAFLNDPQVTCQVDTAAALFRDLVAANEEYLSAWEFESADVLEQ